jgi:hypothetical protein
MKMHKIHLLLFITGSLFMGSCVSSSKLKHLKKPCNLQGATAPGWRLRLPR